MNESVLLLLSTFSLDNGCTFKEEPQDGGIFLLVSKSNKAKCIKRASLVACKLTRGQHRVLPRARRKQSPKLWILIVVNREYSTFSSQRWRRYVATWQTCQSDVIGRGVTECTFEEKKNLHINHDITRRTKTLTFGAESTIEIFANKAATFEWLFLWDVHFKFEINKWGPPASISSLPLIGAVVEQTGSKPSARHRTKSVMISARMFTSRCVWTPNGRLLDHQTMVGGSGSRWVRYRSRSWQLAATQRVGCWCRWAGCCQRWRCRCVRPSRASEPRTRNRRGVDSSDFSNGI